MSAINKCLNREFLPPLTVNLDHIGNFDNALGAHKTQVRQIFKKSLDSVNSVGNAAIVDNVDNVDNVGNVANLGNYIYTLELFETMSGSVSQN